MDAQKLRILETIENPLENLVTDPDTGRGYARSVRSQADNLGDYYSDLTGTVNTEDSLVRPEFGPETDINNILKNHGIQTQQRPIKYGEEVDYTLDLQQAMTATERASEAHRTIPEELRQKYPKYQDWLNAINSGQYFADLQDLAEVKKRKADKIAQEKAAKDAEEADAPKPPTDTKRKPKISDEGVS